MDDSADVDDPDGSIDGFEDGVNGYVDVEDQLTRSLLDRAAGAFAATREAKRSIDTVEAFEARRDRIREDVLSALGGLPERPARPDVERTGTVERAGYAVETVIFESLPWFHVTANCYVPDGEGPHPGILFLCGHVGEAKADELNQRACAELALNGFVVLAVDPVAQGERRQYRDPETGEELVGGGGGVFAHCYAGRQCLYAGANLMRYVVHDARRGLDYLVGRPDADGDRVGVVGTSGGGLQAQYLALLDDRVDVAAPCCSVTTREEWLKTGKRIDAEQLVPGAIPRGIDYDDFVAAMAPRPVCIGAAASDEYFPIEGVHEAHERVRAVYDLYDAAGNVELVVADETHCSVHEVGAGVYEFLCDHLGDGDYRAHDVQALDPSKLHCTPEGSVVAAYPDERTIDDLVSEYVHQRYPGDGRGSVAVEREPEAVRQSVVERFDLDRDPPERHPRFVAAAETGGLAVEHVFFKTERNPDVVVTGVLVSDPGGGADSGPRDDDTDEPSKPPAVVLYEEGTGELPGRSGDLAALAREHGTVLAFDPRGVGAVRNRRIPIPTWVEDYHGPYGTEFKLGYDALLLGTSLFGLRVYDALQAVEFLQSETGTDGVALVGEGVGASHALYAAVADPAVERVELRDLGPGFREMATSREYPYETRLTVFDVLECDVPHCLRVLDRRGVSVDRTNV